MKSYPDELDNRSPEWLSLQADLETGWDEREPHQVVSRDFVAGDADQIEQEAS